MDQASAEPPQGLLESPISSSATECLRLFGGLCSEIQSLSTDTATSRGFDRNVVLLDIQEASVKFRGWGSNIAAFKKLHNPASLDSRLIEAHDVRARLLIVLQGLKEYLEDAIQIVKGEASNQTWVGEISDSDSDLGLNEINNNALGNVSELEDLCVNIKESNRSLMQISMLIRLSSNRDDYLKAASRYKDWDPSYDIGHVREKFGSAKGSSGWLIDRLGKAILKRRQFLKYREEHHGKMTGDWGEDLEEIAEDKPSEIPQEAKTEARTKATTFVVDGNRGKQDGSDTGSFGSQTSYEATEFGGDGHPIKLTVPSPPRWAFPDVLFQYGHPFQCPYCYTEQEVKNRASWKKHVYRDLRPYVCSFAACNMRMFRSRNEWFAHELQCHRREWICQYCQHRPFASAASYSRHLASDHHEVFKSSQPEALLFQGEEPVDQIDASACPLCDEWKSNLDISNQHGEIPLEVRNQKSRVTIKQFRRHLGRHMEQLALFALPIEKGDLSEDNSDGPEIVASDPSSESDFGPSFNYEVYKQWEGIPQAQAHGNEMDEGWAAHEGAASTRSASQPGLFDSEQEQATDEPWNPQNNSLSQQSATELHRKSSMDSDEGPVKNAQSRGMKVGVPCITCIYRRVKCDETKPECIRCQNFGRMCGGYAPEAQKLNDEEKEEAVKEYQKKEAERMAKEKREKDEREEEYRHRLEEDLRKVGMSEKQIDTITKKELAIDPSRITYTRMSRRHLSIETLVKYKIDYEIDQDPYYVLIKRWVPEPEQNILWAHTKEIRERRKGEPGPAFEPLAPTHWHRAWSRSHSRSNSRVSSGHSSRSSIEYDIERRVRRELEAEAEMVKTKEDDELERASEELEALKLEAEKEAYVKLVKVELAFKLEEERRRGNTK